MKSRERMQTILSHRSPDRMGLFDHFWAETLPRWVREGYPTRPENGRPLPPVDVFDYDLEILPLGLERAPRVGVSEIVEETEEWRVVRNGAGAMFKSWKHKTGVPQQVGFEITSRKEWDPIKEPLLELDPARWGDMDRAREVMAAAHGRDRLVVLCTPFITGAMRHSIGDIQMLESFLLDPDWIHDICRVYTDFYIRHYRYLFEEAGKPDAVFITEDLGFTNGLWASPKVMGELIFPYNVELVDFVHGQGIPIMLHSCGDIRKGIDQIVGCGYDLLQPMEAKVGNNVVDYAERFGDRLAFMGNINVMTLETDDRQAIRREIESKIIPLHDKGIPYVFHSDHSLPPSISYDTYRFALDVYREWRDY